MKVQVTRTHRRGRPVDVNRLDSEPAHIGDFGFSFQEVRGLRRASRVASLRPIENASASVESVIPAIHDVELLAFGDQAMLLSGFEEDDGVRYYQSWYVRWR